MKKVFVALKPSLENLNKVIEIKNEFPTAVSLNWMPAEKIHITVIPPWNETNISDKIFKFNSAGFLAKNILLDFYKIEINRPNNVLWALARPNEQLNTTKGMMHNILNVNREGLSFLPHVTLAKNISQILNSSDIELDWKVIPEKLVLYEIIQTLNGTEYQTLAEKSF